MNEVLGLNGETTVSQSRNFEGASVTGLTQKPTFEAAKPRKSVEDTPPWTDSEDEDLDYFKSLADD